MRYGITRLVLGCPQFIGLLPVEYDATRTAKKKLLGALSIEEKFNLVMENYAEFELELQRLITRQYVFTEHSWSSAVDDIHTADRRIVNLLSSGRLYFDHLMHEVRKLYDGDRARLEQMKKAFSAEYDGCLGYRVMVVLRNYVQHRGLAVRQMRYGRALDERKSVNLVKHTCTLSFRVSDIAADGGLTAKIVAELKRDGEDVDITPLIRDYISALGRVHLKLRLQLSEDVKRWEGQIESIQRRFRDQYGDHVIGLGIVERDEDGELIESADIFQDFITRRRALERKNQRMDRFGIKYVSTEAIPTSSAAVVSA